MTTGVNGAMDKDRGGGGYYWVLERRWGYQYNFLTQLTISHTCLPRERKWRGGGKMENGRTLQTNNLQIHKLPVFPKLSHTKYLLSTHASLY